MRLLSPSWGQPYGPGFTAAISGRSVASVPQSPAPGQAGSRCRQLLPFSFSRSHGMDGDGMRNPPRRGQRWKSLRPLGISPHPTPPALFSSCLNPAYVSVWWAAVKIALGLS